MNGYTSGYRAAHGLPKVNHDPEPWLDSDGSQCAWAGGETPGIKMPRLEFDVLDNPILALARWAFEDGRPAADRLAFYKDGLDWLNRKRRERPFGELCNEDEFARRVFEHLVCYARLVQR